MRLHTAFLGLLLLTSAASADPAWWATRGVKSTAPSANFAPANIGQAKHMASMALAELQGKLPPASYQALQADVALIVNLSLPDPLPPGYHETQRAVLLNGQLKAIAKPFYDHLKSYNSVWLDQAMTANQLMIFELGGTGPSISPYPWTQATTDDANRTVATLGQLKAVFSLPLESLTASSAADSDGDGLPDVWEIQHGLNPNDPNDAGLDADNDGITNLLEYLAGLNPQVADAPDQDLDGISAGNEIQSGLDLQRKDNPAVNLTVVIGN